VNSPVASRVGRGAAFLHVRNAESAMRLAVATEDAPVTA